MGSKEILIMASMYVSSICMFLGFFVACKFLIVIKKEKAFSPSWVLLAGIILSWLGHSAARIYHIYFYSLSAHGNSHPGHDVIAEYNALIGSGELNNFMVITGILTAIGGLMHVYVSSRSMKSFAFFRTILLVMMLSTIPLFIVEYYGGFLFG